LCDTSPISPYLKDALKSPYPPKERIARNQRLQLYDYWRNPIDGMNEIEDYANCDPERSLMLVNIINRLSLNKNASMIELGCNVGRNLHYLHNAGYTNLEGVEIRSEAVLRMRQLYGLVIPVHVCPVEEMIRQLPERDLIFTMALLEHLHTDSEFVFDEMVRVAKYIVTIEDERCISWRHFPRNYKDVFESRGMEQIAGWKNLPTLPNSFRARVFKKEVS